MLVDHIFIFSNTAGKEADDLVHFGFTEGSNRIHPGQGTVNRKFYVENFFLEILWIHDKAEIKSKTTSITKLWERSQFQKNNCSPFGLCFVNTDDTDALFQDAKKYQPNYFPNGMSIDIITNEYQPQFPWTFRLPYKGAKKKTTEPTQHANNIKQLTRVTFDIAKTKIQNDFTKLIAKNSIVTFKASNSNHLTLEFDKHQQRKRKEFPALQLTILY